MVDLLGQILTNIGSETFYTFFIKAVNVLIIIILGFFIVRLSGSLISKIFNLNKIKAKLELSGYGKSFESLVSTVVKYSIYFIVAIAVLHQVGMSQIVLYLISAVITIIFLLAVSVSVIDFFPNMAAGFYIRRHKLVKKGDKVRLKNISGIVQQVGITSTLLKTKDKNAVVPNSKIMHEAIIKKK
ncbi:MAG: mechanosensitive ion channel [Candidatus Nanoarchaeia archaeon]|nr:mechanosensitive ion channel [Candidatus Nanoarchaeia archaeon]